MFKYLLRLPLTEIDAFIVEASVDSKVREKVIPHVQAEFAKSTAIPDFLKTLIVAKAEYEKKLLDSNKSLKSEKEKEERQAVSLFIHIFL